MTGLVLAAGQGRRMGQPKAGVRFDGRSLAWRAAETLLAGGLDRVVVALRETLDLPIGAEAFLVPDPDGEPLDTIRQARAVIGPGPVVLLPVDCPMVRSETVRRLVAAYRPPFTKPTYLGQGGHPVIFDIPLTGSGTLRDLLRAVEGQRLEVDDPGILNNWNTPADVRSQA